MDFPEPRLKLLPEEGYFSSEEEAQLAWETNKNFYILSSCSEWNGKLINKKILLKEYTFIGVAIQWVSIKTEDNKEIKVENFFKIKFPETYGIRYFAQAICWSVPSLQKALEDKTKNSKLPYTEVILTDKSEVVHSRYIWNKGKWEKI